MSLLLMLYRHISHRFRLIQVSLSFHFHFSIYLPFMIYLSIYLSFYLPKFEPKHVTSFYQTKTKNPFPTSVFLPEFYVPIPRIFPFIGFLFGFEPIGFGLEHGAPSEGKGGYKNTKKGFRKNHPAKICKHHIKSCDFLEQLKTKPAKKEANLEKSSESTFRCQWDFLEIKNPKDPWTLQWRGCNLYSRGPGSQNRHFLRGQDTYGLREVWIFLVQKSRVNS